MPHIAIATMHAYVAANSILPDDGWLRDDLTSRGHSVDIRNWRDPDVRWLGYDAIVISSTWDIPQHPAEYERWLADGESDGQQRFINDSAVVRTGIRKGDYLSHLIEAFGEDEKPQGSIIATRFYSPTAPDDERPYLQHAAVGGLRDLVDALDATPQWQGRDLVIKPITSADSLDTYLFHRSGRTPLAARDHVLRTWPYAEEAFDKIIASPNSNGVMVQVYQPEIETTEYGLVYFGGTLSHITYKGAGFRGNDEKHWHAINIEDAPNGMIDFAERLLAHMAGKHGQHAISRTRVDLLAGEHGPLLLELEFVEPSVNLWVIDKDFGADARNAATQRYATAIENRVAMLGQ